MDITLEKIELVKDRTGVSYKEAKEALEKTGGSVVDAIIYIEDQINADEKNTDKDVEDTTIIANLKALIKKGNASRILVKDSNDKVILNAPVNVGIIGAVISPIGMVAATIAAFGFKCSVQVVKNDGSIIELSEKASDAYEKASEKGSEVYNKVKNSETTEKIIGMASEGLEKATESFKNKINMSKTEDDVDDLVEELEDDFDFDADKF